jgi:hypothetical protein
MVWFEFVRHFVSCKRYMVTFAEGTYVYIGLCQIFRYSHQSLLHWVPWSVNFVNTDSWLYVHHNYLDHIEDLMKITNCCTYFQLCFVVHIKEANNLCINVCLYSTVTSCLVPFCFLMFPSVNVVNMLSDRISFECYAVFIYFASLIYSALNLVTPSNCWAPWASSVRSSCGGLHCCWNWQTYSLIQNK